MYLSAYIHGKGHDEELCIGRRQNVVSVIIQGKVQSNRGSQMGRVLGLNDLTIFSGVVAAFLVLFSFHF